MTAYEFIKAAGIKPFDKTIDVCFDASGDIYEIPNYCINWPFHFIIEKEKEEEPEEEIEVLARKGSKELTLNLINTMLVEQLKELLACKRVFYNGKELVEGKKLTTYGIKEGSVVIYI